MPELRLPTLPKVQLGPSPHSRQSYRTTISIALQLVLGTDEVD